MDDITAVIERLQRIRATPNEVRTLDSAVDLLREFQRVLDSVNADYLRTCRAVSDAESS